MGGTKRRQLDELAASMQPIPLSLLTTIDTEVDSPLVRFRPLVQNDFDALFEVARDPLIWEQHPFPNRYQLEPFKGLFKKLIEFGGALLITTPDGRAIGSSSYYDYEPQKNRIAIGYTFIAREFWGGKYNSEIKRIMIDRAFLSVSTIHFHVGRDNLRSRQALEKIGASLIGESEIHGQIRLVFEKTRG